MKDRLIVLTACLIAITLLAGCKGGGSSLGSFFGENESAIVNLPDDGGSDNGGSDPINGGHTPEPVTTALLGSGLLAYALLRRRKRK